VCFLFFEGTRLVNDLFSAKKLAAGWLPAAGWMADTLAGDFSLTQVDTSPLMLRDTFDQMLCLYDWFCVLVCVSSSLRAHAW
jgi:hypothetical protein